MQDTNKIIAESIKEVKEELGLDPQEVEILERIGEYTYSRRQSTDTEDGSSISTLVKNKNKRMIIFTFIK